MFLLNLGFLVSTVGQKIYIWQFKVENKAKKFKISFSFLFWKKYKIVQDKELHGIAFIDSNVYIHQIHALKNFLLVGDVYKSINVLQYQQDYR